MHTGTDTGTVVFAYLPTGVANADLRQVPHWDFGKWRGFVCILAARSRPVYPRAPCIQAKWCQSILSVPCRVPGRGRFSGDDSRDGSPTRITRLHCPLPDDAVHEATAEGPLFFGPQALSSVQAALSRSVTNRRAVRRETPLSSECRPLIEVLFANNPGFFLSSE